MVELAWLWLRHQPASGLARWFSERVARNGGRLKKAMIDVRRCRISDIAVLLLSY